MSNSSLNTTELVSKILAIPTSRLGRYLRTPIRNTVIAITREIGVKFSVTSKLIWGDQFNGVIPEGVTALIWRHGFYEETTSIFILQNLKYGGCFVDIGAHFGYFTILASRIVGPNGHVVAVEAMPETYKMLKKNIDQNMLSNVESLDIAASSKEQTLIFKDFGIVNSSLNTSSIARGTMLGKEKFGKEVKINAMSLDDILNELNSAPVMIKIDVESSEEDVLLGLRGTLAKHAPITIIELGGEGDKENQDHRIREIFGFMASFNYKGYNFDGKQLSEIKKTQNLPYTNVIFLQQSKLQSCVSEQLPRLDK